MKRNAIILGSMLFLTFLIVSLFTLSTGNGKLGLYSDPEFWKGLIVEAHGMILDTFVVGLILLIINSIFEKRRAIQELHDKIDFNRPIKSIESKQNILSCIKLLNKEKVFKIDLHQCDLSASIFNDLNLTGSSLHSTNFYLSNLKNSILQKINAERPKFNEGRIINSSFNDSRLYRAEMKKMIARGSKFINCTIIRTFFDESDLNNADFRRSKFDKVSFNNSILKNVDFRKCTFGDQISFLGADLNSAKFLLCKNLKPIDIIQANSAHNAKFDAAILEEINRLRPGFIN